MTKPHRLSVDEAQEEFICQIWRILEYWEKQGKSKRDTLEGFMHSFFASGIDGESLALPAMKLIPIVPGEDRKFHIENGENWFPTEDIAGGLNDLMFNIGRKHGFVK